MNTKIVVSPIDHRFVEAADRAEIEAMFHHNPRSFARDKRSLDETIDSPLGELFSLQHLATWRTQK